MSFWRMKVMKSLQADQVGVQTTELLDALIARELVNQGVVRHVIHLAKDYVEAVVMQIVKVRAINNVG